MPYIGTPPASELANLDINGQKLIIDADADTSITADTDDQIDIEIAGSDQIKIAAGEVAFNDASGDIDFRVESNGNANMFTVNAGSDIVGIGADPDQGVGLHIKTGDSSLTVDANADELVIETNGTKQGISFLQPQVSGNISAINWAAGADANGCSIECEMNDEDLFFYVNNSAHGSSYAMKMTGGDNSTTFGGDVKMIGTTPTLTIGDAGAEDTKIVFDGNAQDFHIGLDDGTDDLYIGLGSTLGTTTHMAFTEDGEITTPLNPWFHVYTGGVLSNVTGNGTEYTVIFSNELDDIGANYNTSNGIFTAPVTGNYQFNTNLRLQGYSGNEYQVQQYWITSNEGTRSYDEVIHDAAVTNLYDAGDGQISAKFNSAAFRMDAGDTCAVMIIVGGSGSDLIDINAYSYFSGYLIG